MGKKILVLCFDVYNDHNVSGSQIVGKTRKRKARVIALS